MSTQATTERQTDSEDGRWDAFRGRLVREAKVDKRHNTADDRKQYVERKVAREKERLSSKVARDGFQAQSGPNKDGVTVGSYLCRKCGEGGIAGDAVKAHRCKAKKTANA